MSWPERSIPSYRNLVFLTQPTTTRENRTGTNNPESINKINKKTNTAIKKLVTREQNKCQETKDIIELVKRKVKPTRNEAKSKSDYAKNLLESYENLEVIDECLHMNVMAYDTKQRTTIVILDQEH